MTASPSPYLVLAMCMLLATVIVLLGLWVAGR